MEKKREVKNYIILTSIFIYALCYFLLIVRFIPNYANIINCIFIIGLTFITFKSYGFQKYGLNDLRKSIITEVFIAVFLYFTIIYLLGLFTGYASNSFSLKFISMFKNSFLPLLSLCSIEIFRYIFISSNRDMKKFIPYMTMAIILLDVALNFYFFDLNLVKTFIFITVTVLPIILKNIVLSYLSYQVGYHACLLYVIPLGLYQFFVPVIPNLGNYLNCVIGMVFPSLVYIYASRIITNYLEEKKIKKLRIIKIFVLDIPLILIFTIFIGLISGHFNYHLIGLDASSLEPQFKRGDAVMIDKTLDYKEYRKGDIIAYASKDKIIIDRISKAEIDSNGYIKLYITTEKNEGKEDTYRLLSDDEILGKYNNFKVSKVAYPTIWFREFIKGDVNETK